MAVATAIILLNPLTRTCTLSILLLEYSDLRKNPVGVLQISQLAIRYMPDTPTIINTDIDLPMNTILLFRGNKKPA